MNPGDTQLAEMYFQPLHKNSLWKRVCAFRKSCTIVIMHSSRLTHKLVFLLNNKLLFLLLLLLLQVGAVLAYEEPVWIGGYSVVTNKALLMLQFWAFCLAYLLSWALTLKSHTALLNSVTAKIPPSSSSNSFLMNDKITSDITQLLQALYTVQGIL